MNHLCSTNFVSRDMFLRPSETTDRPVDLRLISRLIFAGEGGTKARKFIQNIVASRILVFDTPYVTTLQQYTLGFTLIYCQVYVRKFIFDCTKSSSNIPPGTPNDFDFVSLCKFLDACTVFSAIAIYSIRMVRRGLFLP